VQLVAPQQMQADVSRGRTWVAKSKDQEMALDQRSHVKIDGRIHSREPSDYRPDLCGIGTRWPSGGCERTK